MIWPRKSLAELLELSVGGVWGKAPGVDEVDVRVARVTELRPGGRLDFATAAQRSVTKRQLASRELQRGDLLLEKSGGGPRTPVGRVGLVNQTENHTICANFMQLLRPKQQLIEPRFLHLYLHFFHLVGRTEPMQTASTNIRNIKASEYTRIQVPVPELPEQQWIVEILEDHLSHLDAAIAYASDATRRVAAWAEARRDQILWGSGWPTVAVTDLIREPMRNGRSDRRAPDGVKGIRTLTLTAVTSGHFTDENTKMTITDASRAENLWLQSGDILVQRANTPDLVGTTAWFGGPNRWAIFPDLLIRVRADETAIDSRLLAAGLQSERAHRALRAKAKGLAGSMPKIDQSAVGTTVVPVPPQDQQPDVIAQLESVDITVTALRSELISTESRTSALRRAVLKAAFTGRLTGQHTDQEVIEELAT